MGEQSSCHKHLYYQQQKEEDEPANNADNANAECSGWEAPRKTGHAATPPDRGRKPRRFAYLPGVRPHGEAALPNRSIDSYVAIYLR